MAWINFGEVHPLVFPPRLTPSGEYKVKVEYNVLVPMRDGVNLSANIYRPEAPGRFPVLLLRTPYNKNVEENIDEPKLARYGYVVVIQDVRGRHDSQGEFYPFLNEARDGCDSQQWCATQEWSNGNVGAVGRSYYGFTQLLPAILGSPVLKAMNPVMTGSDVYKDWLYPDGAFALEFALAWGATYMDGHTNQLTDIGDWSKFFRHLPLVDAAEALGHGTRHYRDWTTHPDYDSYWNHISARERMAQVKSPAYFMGGWYDIFLRATLDDYKMLREKGSSNEARQATRVLIGPWSHNLLNQTQVGEIDYGPRATVDLLGLKQRWFDYWLKGIDNDLLKQAPVRIFVMGDNVWRDEWEWPPARTRYCKFYLHSGGHANSLHGDGTLDMQLPEAGEPPDHFTYDPADPVPTLGGNTCCWPEITTMGPFDQQAVEQRHDVLVYTTEPLDHDLEVTGPVTAKLFVVTSVKDTDFTVKLVDVYPDRRAMNVCDGIVVARYRESLEKPSLLTPDKVYELGVDMWSTSQVFKRGHRLRVEVSSSNFPHFARNLNTGEPPGTSKRVLQAHQTLYHDPSRPSHTCLPVIPR